MSDTRESYVAATVTVIYPESRVEIHDFSNDTAHERALAFARIQASRAGEIVSTKSRLDGSTHHVVMKWRPELGPEERSPLNLDSVSRYDLYPGLEIQCHHEGKPMFKPMIIVEYPYRVGPDAKFASSIGELRVSVVTQRSFDSTWVIEEQSLGDLGIAPYARLGASGWNESNHSRVINR